MAAAAGSGGGSICVGGSSGGGGGVVPRWCRGGRIGGGTEKEGNRGVAATAVMADSDCGEWGWLL